MAVNKDVAKAAVFLVGSPSYKKIQAQLIKTVEAFEEVPMTFAGDLSPLNALVELGVHSPTKFDKAMVAIRNRRREIDRMTDEEQRVKRNDYMREYMREYRSRERGDRPTASSLNKDIMDIISARK